MYALHSQLIAEVRPSVQCLLTYSFDVILNRIFEIFWWNLLHSPREDCLKWIGSSKVKKSASKTFIWKGQVNIFRTLFQNKPLTFMHFATFLLRMPRLCKRNYKITVTLYYSEGIIKFIFLSTKLNVGFLLSLGLKVSNSVYFP